MSPAVSVPRVAALALLLVSLSWFPTASGRGKRRKDAGPGVVPTAGHANNAQKRCHDLREHYKLACHSAIDEKSEYGNERSLASVGETLRRKAERLDQLWGETVVELRQAVARAQASWNRPSCPEPASLPPSCPEPEHDSGSGHEGGSDVFELPHPQQLLNKIARLATTDRLAELENLQQNPFALLQTGLALPSSSALLKFLNGLRMSFKNEGGALLRKQKQCLDLRKKFYEPVADGPPGACPEVLHMRDTPTNTAAGHRHAVVAMERLWRPALERGVGLLERVETFLEAAAAVTRRRFQLEGMVESTKKQQIEQLERWRREVEQRKTELKEWEAEQRRREEDERTLAEGYVRRVAELGGEIERVERALDAPRDSEVPLTEAEREVLLQRLAELVTQRQDVRQKLFELTDDRADGGTSSCCPPDDDLRELKKIQNQLDETRERQIEDYFNKNAFLRKEFLHKSILDTFRAFVKWLQIFRREEQAKIGVFHFRMWMAGEGGSLGPDSQENWVLVGVKSSGGEMALLHAFPRKETKVGFPTKGASSQNGLQKTQFCGKRDSVCRTLGMLMTQQKSRTKWSSSSYLQLQVYHYPPREDLGYSSYVYVLCGLLLCPLCRTNFFTHNSSHLSRVRGSATCPTRSSA